MSRVLRSKILKDIKRILNEDNGAGGVYDASGGATEASGEAVNIEEKLQTFKRFLIGEKKIPNWNETEWKYFATDYSSAKKNWPKDKVFKPYEEATEERIDGWVKTLFNTLEQGKNYFRSGDHDRNWKEAWSNIYGILTTCGYRAVIKTKEAYDSFIMNSSEATPSYALDYDKNKLLLSNIVPKAAKGDTFANNIRHLFTIATYPNILLMDDYWQQYIANRLPQMAKYSASPEFTKICQEQAGKCVGDPAKPIPYNDMPAEAEYKKGKIYFVQVPNLGLQRWDYDETGKLIQKLDSTGKPILDAQQQAQAQANQAKGLPAPGQPGSSPQFPMSLEQFNNYVNPNAAQVAKESFIRRKNKPLLKEETPATPAADPKTRNPKEGTLFVKDSDGSIKQVQYQNYQRVRVLDADNRPSELAGDKAAAEASGAAGRKGQYVICTGEPDLIPNLQRWLIYAKGQKLNLDGIFGPQTFDSLKKSDPQAATQINDKAKVCPFLRSKKAVYTNEYTAKINADAKLKAQESKINAVYNAAVEKNKAGGTAAGAGTSAAPKQPVVDIFGRKITKESRNYEQFYDNKKIKNADLLFEKLIKISTNKGKV